MRLIPTHLLLFLGATLSLPAGAETFLEQARWPAPKQCVQCTVLQFGPIEMRLPAELVEKILVVGVGSHSVLLVAPGAASVTGTVLLSANRQDFVGKYAALMTDAGSIDAATFLDRIGAPSTPASGLGQIRRIEGIQGAQRYVRSSKDSVHAYWVQAKRPGIGYLHLVLDGDDTIYTLAGDIDVRLCEAILGNLRRLPAP